MSSRAAKRRRKKGPRGAGAGAGANGDLPGNPGDYVVWRKVGGKPLIVKKKPRKGERKGRDFAVQLKDGSWHVQIDRGYFEVRTLDEKPADFTVREVFTPEEFRCDDSPFWNIGETTIRGKWMMDGAKTLSEAAAKLRATAERLEKLEKKGWQLSGRIGDDYGHAHIDVMRIPARD